MKQNEVKVGNCYLFARTETDHKKILIGRIVHICGKRKGRKKINKQGGIVTGTGNSPIRFKIGWYNMWANASELHHLPNKVAKLFDSEVDFEETYEDCERLMKKLNKIGYTCDYYLDADPYDFRKIGVKPFVSS